MKTFLITLAALAVPFFPSLHADDLLTPSKPIELKGTHGKFDFIKIDAAQRRLLACHTGNGSLDVIDIDKGQLVKSISTGAAQGVAIDEKGGRYFVSCSKPAKLVIIDSAKLEVTGEVPLTSPADVLAYNPSLDRVFVDNDEKPEMWVIDPNTKTIINDIMLPGAGMEDLGFNADGSFLFQNLKDANKLAKIDPKEGKVVDAWPTTPADKPHGLEIVANADAALVAGGTGKLALIDLKTGQVVVSTDIAAKVDELAYDPGLGRAYAASGAGTISIAFVGTNKLSTLGSVPSAPGAHSIAVDPKTHTVWIAFATKDGKPCVQSFSAK